MGDVASPSQPRAVRSRDFRLLWLATTLSLTGSQVTAVALPLVAVITLHASVGQVAVLGALRWLPYLAFGLVVGAWLDRRTRRSLMIATDLARFAAVGSIPVLAVLGELRIEALDAVAVAIGVCSLVFDGAYQAFLPGLLAEDELLEGNERLGQSVAVTQSGGPALGGLIVQLATAPYALVADAASYVASAALLHAIPDDEPRPAPATGRLRGDIRRGIAWVYGERHLRSIALTSHGRFLFASVAFTLYPVVAVRALHLKPLTIGLTLAAAGVGGVVGASLSGRAGRRYGIGPASVTARALEAGAAFLLPAATFTGHAAAPVLAALAFALMGFSIGVESPLELTFRQRITPAGLQGRMNTTIRSFNWGTTALGALAAGGLAGALGLRVALVVAAAGLVVAAAALAFSPYRALGPVSTLPRA